jgi:hypothetical protein
MEDVKEVSAEELEALKERVIEYENLIMKNKSAEKELEALKQQRMALEEKQKQAGEARGL